LALTIHKAVERNLGMRRPIGLELRRIRGLFRRLVPLAGGDGEPTLANLLGMGVIRQSTDRFSDEIRL
jgi:hypothetical protein